MFKRILFFFQIFCVFNANCMNTNDRHRYDVSQLKKDIEDAKHVMVKFDIWRKTPWGIRPNTNRALFPEYIETKFRFSDEEIKELFPSNLDCFFTTLNQKLYGLADYAYQRSIVDYENLTPGIIYCSVLHNIDKVLNVNVDSKPSMWAYCTDVFEYYYKKFLLEYSDTCFAIERRGSQFICYNEFFKHFGQYCNGYSALLKAEANNTGIIMSEEWALKLFEPLNDEIHLKFYEYDIPSFDKRIEEIYKIQERSRKSMMTSLETVISNYKLYVECALNRRAKGSN